jgi:hypothetical protein
MGRISPRTRWWAWCLLGLGPLFSAVIWRMDGNGLAALAATGTAGMFVIARAQALIWFRRGWHAGFVEGLKLEPESAGGKVPSALLRQMSSGDPAPGPWDRMAADVRLFPHDPED